MTPSGHASRTLIPAITILAGALSIATALVFSGFCVDDALISIRYAQNLIAGHGYAFNPDARATDGVTPLVWAPLIAPLVSHADLFSALDRLKGLTIFLHGITCALVVRCALRDAKYRWRVLLVLAGMFFVTPLCAWAASGMEIAPATLLVTIAVTSRARAGIRAGIVGCAALFRPELGAFAVAYALAISFGENKARPAALIGHALVAATPFMIVALIRVFVFGHPAPLAVAAKPSDFSHGLVYASAGAIAAAGFVAAFAPIAIVRGIPGDRAIAIACIVHLFVIVALGGDSMPFARLFVPIVPALFFLAARATETSSRVAMVTRVALVTAIDLFGLWKWAPEARRTLRDRTELARATTRELEGAHVIATLDIGWVAAASDSTATKPTIFDLAGVTDPEIAYLPGGHTSKEISPSMLEARHVDTLIILEKAGNPARVVEARLLAAPLIDEHFKKRATIPIGTTGLSYGIYRAKPQ